MAIRTTPEAPDTAYRSPFGQELAPSALRADEPSFARFVGMTALGAVFVGAAVIFFNRISPRWINEFWGYVFVLLGTAGLLFHASRDADVQVRRTYGVLGGFLPLALGVAVTLLPFGGHVGAMFLPWGALGLAVGLVFLLPFVGHEDDPAWRRAALGTLVGVGAALALVGFIGGSIAGSFLLNPGLLLILLGLAYLWAAVGTLGSGTDLGYRLSLVIGAVGLVVILVALARSFLPPLLALVGAGGGTARYFLPDGLLLSATGLLYVALAVGICSEVSLVVLSRRELASYFYSPIAYIVLFGLTAVTWFYYAQFVSYLMERTERNQPLLEPVVQNVFVSIIPVMAVIFVVPVITMRLLSEEKRTGTLEVLLTAPVNESTVVLSKFFAGLMFYLFLWVPWALFLVVLRVEGGRAYDYRPLLSFFVVLVCTGAAFISLGLFFSSLTRNQIIAAVLSFMGMILLLVLYFFKGSVGPNTQAVLSQISFVDQWIQSLDGKLYLRSVIVQLSIAAFFLFLTVKVMEARKWS